MSQSTLSRIPYTTASPTPSLHPSSCYRQSLPPSASPASNKKSAAMLSRTLQGAYGKLTPIETLQRSHRQDRLYWLHNEQIEEIFYSN